MSKKEYYQKNKKKIIKYSKEYRTKNREKIKKYKHNYYLKNKDKIRKSVKLYQINNFSVYKKYHLKKTYNLSLEEFGEMLDRCGRRCEICGQELIIYSKNGKTGKTACVDHDHKTGENRGILCGHCNSVIGYAKDEIEILQKAIKYIKNKHKKHA